MRDGTCSSAPVDSAGRPPGRGSPFAVRAALSGLFAMPAAVAVATTTGFVVDASRPSVAVRIVTVAIAIVSAGFLLNVVALSARPWSDRKRVVGRAVVGLAVNGATLAAPALVVARLGGPDPKGIVGRWARRIPTPAGNSDDALTLAADVTCRETVRAASSGVVDDGSGTWKLDGRQLLVTVDRVDVGSAAEHRTGVYGAVGDVAAGDLVLFVGRGETPFHRTP